MNIFTRLSPPTEYAGGQRRLTLKYEVDSKDHEYLDFLMRFMKRRINDDTDYIFPRTFKLLPGLTIDHVIRISNFSVDDTLILPSRPIPPRNISITFIARIPKE